MVFPLRTITNPKSPKVLGLTICICPLSGREPRDLKIYPPLEDLLYFLVFLYQSDYFHFPRTSPLSRGKA